VHAGQTDLPVAEARAVCADKMSASFSPAGVSPDTVLSFVSSMGMITERRGRLRFAQQRFQDYFAADALLERFAAGTDISNFWQNGSGCESAVDGWRREPWRVPAGWPTSLWDEPTVLAAVFSTTRILGSPRSAG